MTPFGRGEKSTSWKYLLGPGPVMSGAMAVATIFAPLLSTPIINVVSQTIINDSGKAPVNGVPDPKQASLQEVLTKTEAANRSASYVFVIASRDPSPDFVTTAAAKIANFADGQLTGYDRVAIVIAGTIGPDTIEGRNFNTFESRAASAAARRQPAASGQPAIDQASVGAAIRMLEQANPSQAKVLVFLNGTLGQTTAPSPTPTPSATATPGVTCTTSPSPVAQPTSTATPTPTPAATPEPTSTPVQVCSTKAQPKPSPAKPRVSPTPAVAIPEWPALVNKAQALSAGAVHFRQYYWALGTNEGADSKLTGVFPRLSSDTTSVDNVPGHLQNLPKQVAQDAAAQAVRSDLGRGVDIAVNARAASAIRPGETAFELEIRSRASFAPMTISDLKPVTGAAVSIAIPPEKVTVQPGEVVKVPATLSWHPGGYPPAPWDRRVSDVQLVVSYQLSSAFMEALPLATTDAGTVATNSIKHSLRAERPGEPIPYAISAVFAFLAIVLFLLWLRRTNAMTGVLMASTVDGDRLGKDWRLARLRWNWTRKFHDGQAGARVRVRAVPGHKRIRVYFTPNLDRPDREVSRQLNEGQTLMINGVCFTWKSRRAHR